MGIFFSPNSYDKCCLCGSKEDLTGEHKIKKSAIAVEFGASRMVIGTFGDDPSALRPVQGPKSKALHFEAKVCKNCNNNRTQPADREFDKLHADARALFDSGADPAMALSENKFPVGTAPYLNVFRYFAKLLCCHMAQSGAPRPLHMSKFAIGESNRNCIWLKIDTDVTYKELQSSWEGELQYAAHGGLVVYGRKSNGSANGFHSTLTIGPIRYVFWTRLTQFEHWALRLAHPKFDAWCQDQVSKAKERPISDGEKDRLGL